MRKTITAILAAFVSALALTASASANASTHHTARFATRAPAVLAKNMSKTDATYSAEVTLADKSFAQRANGVGNQMDLSDAHDWTSVTLLPAGSYQGEAVYAIKDNGGNCELADMSNNSLDIANGCNTSAQNQRFALYHASGGGYEWYALNTNNYIEVGSVSESVKIWVGATTHYWHWCFNYSNPIC